MANKQKTAAQMKREQPGKEAGMHPRPKFEYVLDGKRGRLQGKHAVITGGDSGIGRAVAVAYSAEGANVAILYKEGMEETDAEQTQHYIKRKYRKNALLIGCNVSDEDSCKAAAKKIIDAFDRVDVLVNNAGIHFPTDDVETIGSEQLRLTFQTNVFGMFYLTQALLPAMKSGACVINTASVTAFRGSEHLMDYAATKGAVVAFTRSLALNLAEKNIRVNGVAPGPVINAASLHEFRQSASEKFWKGYGTRQSGAAKRDCTDIRIPGIRRSILHHRTVYTS